MSIERLREWVERTSGLPTIWMHQTGPRPERSFIGIQQMLRRRIGHEELTGVDDDGHQYIIGNREYQISLGAFTEVEFENPRQSLDILAHVQDMSNVPDEADWLYWHNVNILRQHKIQPLPRIISEGYQLKASWDIVVLCRETIRIDQYSIDAVELSNLNVYNSGIAGVHIDSPFQGQQVGTGPVVITGTGEPNAEVNVLGDSTITTTVEPDGTWELTYPATTLGSYTVAVTDGNTVDMVSFDLLSSPINITEPSNGDTVLTPTVVRGTAEPTTWVYVNGERVYVHATGEWVTSLELQDGTITVSDGVTKESVNVQI